MINSYKKPEILAPCGSYDILIAAINAGADACYFGGNKFGARAYATNFDLETSIKAIDYAHIHGTSLYLTVNTLFKDNEIKDLYHYILPYYEAGLDAVIVQDLGVFKAIREMFPDMHIHCSTQMNITSKHAAKAMKDFGASRIVTAREMALSEIREIKDEMDIEIESFVHGAMCYSYSGRCLMSSLAGGRSGNRGRCAQPCRKAYDGQYILSMKDMCTLTDVPQLIEAGIDSLKIEGRMKNEYYVASAVDAYNQIAEDFVNGCYSERKAEELKFKLANIYNRGGFCQGYYFMHNGPEMISKDRPNNQGVKLGKVTYARDGVVGIRLYNELYKQDVLELKLKDDSVIEITSGIDRAKNQDVSLKCPKTKQIAIGEVALRTRCNHILTDVEQNIIVTNKKYDIYGQFKAKIGEPMTLTIGRNINDSYIQVCAEGGIVQEATGRAADIDDVKNKLSQLGNTYYNFAELSLDIEHNAFLPASAIKSIRREAINLLDNQIISKYKRTTNLNITNDTNESYVNYNATDGFVEQKPSIDFGVTTLEQLKLLAGVSYIHGIYITAGLYKSGLKDGIVDTIRSQGIKIYIELPYVVKNSFNIADYLPNEPIDGIYIRNIDGLFACVDFIQRKKLEKPDFKVICGDGVYAYNNVAKDFIVNLIPDVIFELPKELNKKELYNLSSCNNQLVCYEYQQVMLSAQCVIKNKLSCNKANSVIKIRDDKKNEFFARALCGECCNVIYNGLPYMIIDQINEGYIRDIGICSLRFNFTIEDEHQIKDVLNIMKCYLEHKDVTDIIKNANHTYTSGHFNRGVE